METDARRQQTRDGDRKTGDRGGGEEEGCRGGIRGKGGREMYHRAGRKKVSEDTGESV